MYVCIVRCLRWSAFFGFAFLVFFLNLGEVNFPWGSDRVKIALKLQWEDSGSKGTCALLYFKVLSSGDHERAIGSQA